MSVLCDITSTQPGSAVPKTPGTFSVLVKSEGSREWQKNHQYGLQLGESANFHMSCTLLELGICEKIRLG